MKKYRNYGIIITFWLLSVCLLLVSCTAKSTKREVQPPEIIPLEVLLGNPEKASPKISPDGTKMAYLAPSEGVLNVWVRTIGKNDDMVITSDTGSGIVRYFWAEDSKHIMYLQDKEGNENWNLYRVNLEDKNVVSLTPHEEVQVRMIKYDKHHPNKMLIGMNKRDPRFHDAYLLDLENDSIKMVAENPGHILGWLADANLKIRGAYSPNQMGGSDLLVREDEESEWNKIIEWNQEDGLVSGPIKFTKNGQYIYCIDSRNANTGRLVKINASTGEIEEIIAEDSKYDVSQVMIHPDSYEIQAVAFTKERKEWKILDNSIKDDFKNIKELEEGDFSIYNRDNDDDTWLIGFANDDGPVNYYTYNRKNKQGRFLFSHKPELNEYRLNSMKPVSFTSRDGLTIHGYITYPDWKEKKKLPMVLMVHGGPWARDRWGFNPLAQWLANRGYACFQVNFRGSTGYGKDFLNAGNKEWGRKMHYDLVDAVKWAVDRKIADPEKVAIFGGSYGGYAALVGATFTPELFCCAVDICGPSNLITFIESIPPYWAPMKKMLTERIGDPETEREFLKKRSPLFKADQIQVPMLIAQGANDPRVKISESDQIVKALKENNVDYRYVVYEDEGHGLRKPSNRLEFFDIAEKFLAKHLGGRYLED